MYITRSMEETLQSHLFQGKVIIIYGARRTGKTTLAKNIAGKVDPQYHYLNCDELDIRNLLSEIEVSTKLKELIGNYKLVVIDEAQRVRNIGLKLKLLIDNYPETQIIATGSSSFDLANEINEPLTGRNFEFWLYPFSLRELTDFQDSLTANRRLESFMRYGMYPEVIKLQGSEEKQVMIKQIAANYLYKDVLKFNDLKKSEILTKLLQALALQVGNEVSYAELAQLIGINKQSVAKYVEILEKVFVIFGLKGFSRNLRKEISKSRKIYFYDLGIRNALINNFNSLSLRNDCGALWENLLILEKLKQQFWWGNRSNLYFWRTYDQQEIDLIEDKDGQLSAFEFKWNGKEKKAPVAWRQAYPDAIFKVVNPTNYRDFTKSSLHSSAE